jgi:hypothetical protein
MIERSLIGKSLKAVAGVAAFSFGVGDHWDKITGVSAQAPDDTQANLNSACVPKSALSGQSG